MLGLGLLLSAVFPQVTEAHTEGKMQLASAPAGPFKLTVWTSPDPAETGELHVAVAVVMAEDASPVLDADVTVQLAPVNADGQTLSLPATAEDSENKFLYEAVFEPAAAGIYLVNLKVVAADGSIGESSFELQVTGNGGSDWLIVIPIVLAVAAAVLLMLAWRNRPTASQDVHGS